MSELTHKDLKWFWFANAGHPPGFYPFKDRFLRRYAERDGYDLQHINRECWTCEGSGFYTEDDPCRKCGGDGVWRTDENWLERWNLNGCTYHRPVDPLPHWQRKDIEIRNYIEGKIRHVIRKPHPQWPLFDDTVEEVPLIVARRAFYRLLLRHEPVNFFYQVRNDIACKLSNWRTRQYWKLMRLRDKLDLFPAVKELDDVPF